MVDDFSESDQQKKRELEQLEQAQASRSAVPPEDPMADTEPPSNTLQSLPEPPLVANPKPDLSQITVSNSVPNPIRPNITNKPGPQEGAPGPQVGDLIANKYRLLEQLKGGGQGTVWRARREQMGDQVALKLLTLNEHFQEKRVLREAQLLLSMSHEHIVRIHDVQARKDLGMPLIEYELIEGHDLKEEVERELPSVEQAVRWCRDIARAMHHAHERHVIHRDLKPANIMLRTADGQVKVVDFGLAKPLHPVDADDRSLSGPAVVPKLRATLKWAAYEQFNQEATRATDIHAIGSILYFTLTGHAPFALKHGDPGFEEDDWKPHRDRRLTKPTPISELRPKNLPPVPPSLERICLQSLELAPNDRQATAQEFADQLDRFLGVKSWSSTIRIPYRRLISVVAMLVVIGILVANSAATAKRIEANFSSLPLQGDPTLFYPEVLEGPSDRFIPSRTHLWGLTPRETELAVGHLGLMEFGTQQILNDKPLYDVELKMDIKLNQVNGTFVGFFTGCHPDKDNPELFCMDTTLIAYPKTSEPYVQHGKFKIRDPKTTTTSSASEEFGNVQVRRPVSIDRVNWHTLHVIYKSGRLDDVLIDGQSTTMNAHDKARLANEMPYPLNLKLGVFVHQSDVTVRNVQIKVPLMNKT